MVIRTEMTSQRYAMGSSDPFPARLEIQFGSLNFQATGNGYLMRLTNRDELHSWQSIGPGPVTTMLATDAPAPTQAAAASTSTPHVLRATITPGAHRAAPGRTRRGTGGRASAHRRNNAARGGTHGHRVPVSLRNAQCCHKVRLVFQHRHGRI
jgi:hypothetical protein